MGYRIRVVPEVEVWLEQLRDIDPGAADIVDEALDTLREAGAGLGPPLVVPVEIPAQETRPDLDFSYQRQLEMLTRARRRVADVATARKRITPTQRTMSTLRCYWPRAPNATGCRPGTPKCSCVAASATSGCGGAPANVEGCLTIFG